MTKSQLMERIAQKAPHANPRQIEAVVNAVFDQMAQGLKAEGRIELRGFGCFDVKARPARTGRNPKTGAAVQLRRRLAIFFSAGKELRARLNRPAVPPGYLPSVRARLSSVLVPGAGVHTLHQGAEGRGAPRI